MDAKAIEELK
ncbi:hypothetical protein S40293_11607 [Stachybotrys chartarum IBT 40293]|nr:hypothetical protein S40293_11607 [Stachybotrys chartarum IBT 40293]